MIKFFRQIRSFYLQVLFVFLAFTVMVLVSYFFIRGVVQEQMIRYSERTIGSAEYEIKSIFTQYEIALSNFAFSTEHLIRNEYSTAELQAHFQRWTDWLTSNQESFQEFSGVYGFIHDEFIDASGWVPPSDYIPQLKLWYVGAVSANGRINYTAPYVDADTGEFVVSISMVVFDANSRRAGVIAIDFKIASIVEYVNNLSMADFGYGVMLDENLSFVMHPNSDYTELNIIDTTEFKNYAQIGALLEAGEPVSGVLFTDFDGQRSIAYFRTLFNNWHIGIISPLASYNRNVTQMALLLSILGLILASILSYFLIRYSVAKDRSEEESRIKSNFLATMSHEIRTPLNAVIGIAQIELDKDDSPDEHTAAFEKIFNSGNNLLGIINDILDMSKIETGKMEIIPDVYDMPSLINDAVMLNIGRIGSKPIKFDLSVDEKLPLRLIGDELRLKQILSNLLSNAFKYTEEGRVKLTLYHSMEAENFALHFSVEDTGQGMKPEDRDRIFAEYSRFNTKSNRTTEGTGLGMSITKKLVDMMDGTIGVESEYGKGTIVSVMVRQTVADSEPLGLELAEHLSNFTYNKGKLFVNTDRERMEYGKVLVVDDVDINLYVAEGMLTQYGLNVETVLSGFEAIDLVNSGNNYDIIFMDHMMPQMDGIETTQKLRDSGYKGCIVALTANALVGNSEMFMQNGFDGFISKPIDSAQLDVILNEFVRDKHKK